MSNRFEEWFVQLEQNPPTPTSGRSETLAVHDAHGERIAIPDSVDSARIIAAAPNLLYALERVIEEFVGDASEEQLRESGYSATLYKAVTIGRAAIRKARTGE